MHMTTTVDVVVVAVSVFIDSLDDAPGVCMCVHVCVRVRVYCVRVCVCSMC